MRIFLGVSNCVVFGLGLLLAALFPPALAQVLPKGISQITSVEGITEYRLQNGLKVLLMPDASKPTVLVNMTYLIGSRHENYGETGMAHLLEHMLFKGTVKYPKIAEEFKQRDMRSNGTTSLDRTNYFELFQASESNLKWALEMEADRMTNSNLFRTDLDSELRVVRNEYESSENAPGSVLSKRLQSVAYDWHNYGHATIGNRSDIENVKIDNLRAFYRTYYQPDNAVLLVAGKFDTEQTLGWIAGVFGVIKTPSRHLPVFWTVEPTQDGERSVEVRRKGDLQMLMLAYKAPASLHRERDALDFATSILTGAPHGRLHQQLVESGKLVQVFSTGTGIVASGLKIIGAVVKKGESVDGAKELLLAGIENFKKNPPTLEEIERVKRDSMNTFERIINNHETLGIALSEYIAMGDWRYLFKDRDETLKVTPEQVSAAVNHYLIRSNRTVGMFIPEDAPQRAEIPVVPSISAVMRDFQPKTTVPIGEAFDASPANLDQRSLRSSIGGLQVVMLPKKNRGESVHLALNLHWGDERTLFGKKNIAAFAGKLLMTGSGKYTRAQLSDAFSKLKINGGLFSFQTTRENLPAAIALIAHVLREARFPENEFLQMRERTIAVLEAGRSDPAGVAGLALARHFNRYPKGDFRATETIDEAIASLRALQLGDIQAFHRQFYGASQGELAIVGDLDVASTKAAIASAFDAWPSQSPYTRLVSHTEPVAALRQTFNTPGKENAYYTSRMNLLLREDDAEYPALQVANYIFGGGAGLNSRLTERLRQKEGLTYSISSSLTAGDLEADGSFGISVMAAPHHLARLELAINQELSRALKDGFTAEELARAKSGLLQQRQQARTSDAELAAVWVAHLYLGRSWKWSQAMDEKIQALSLEQVNTVFRQAIVPAKMSVFITADEARVKGSGK